MVLLALSLLVLLSGPLLYKLVRREPRAFWALDGFVLASVGGLILFHVLPPTLTIAGPSALLAMLVGLLFPILAEQIRGNGEHPEHLIHKLALGVAFSGLFLHTMMDGITLAAESHDEVSTALASAVLFHRFPVALIVWWLIRPTRGKRWATLALALIALATILGFVVEESLHGLMENVGFAYVQAFIAGSLLHVIAHHPPHEQDHAHAHTHEPSSSCGSDGCGCTHGLTEELFEEPITQDGEKSGCESTSCDEVHDHPHHHEHAHEHPHEHIHEALEHLSHDHAMSPAHDHHHHAAEEDDAHHHHHHEHPHPLMSGLGALTGAALVFILPLLEESAEASSHGGHGHGHGHEVATDAATNTIFALSGYGERFWDLFAESAPALLIGYVLAGVFAAFLPRASMRWMTRGSSPTQALRGVIFGLPIPICSCGVVPLYQSLIRRGVPASAALAFLIATPELGIEALFLSIPLLGVELTITRLIAAALVALLAGWIVGRIIPVQKANFVDVTAQKAPLRERLRSAYDFGLREVLDETGPWILVGLAIAALLSQGGLTGALLDMPDIAQVMLFALISLPLYVCASGATPLAAGLIFAGASPGAALAFLLAGPATNVTTFGVLSSLHNKRIATLFGLVVIGLAILTGLVTNLVFDQLAIDLSTSTHAHEEPNLVQTICALILCALFIVSLLRTGPRHWLQTVLSFGSSHSH